MKKIIIILVCCLSLSISISGKQKFRIAVVPFENLGKVKSYDYLSAGFSETITIGLFQIPDILVVERQGLDRVLREQQLSLTGLLNEKNGVKIGNMVGANYLLVGRYQIHQNKIRVFCKLIDVETGIISRKHSFHKTGLLNNIFDLQDSLVNTIAHSFNINIKNDEKKRIDKVTRDFSANRQAFELYLQARQEFFLSTPESYEKAIALYKKALAQNRNFPLAWAGLSSANLYWGFERSWNNQSYREYYREALDAARRSVKLAPELSETHAALALVYAYWLPEPRRREAEKEANHAISLNPNNAEAYFAISRARKGDISYLKKTIELNPQYILAYNWLGITYQKKNMINDAIKMHETSIRLNPKWALEYANLAYCYYLKGQYRKAMTLINRAISLKPDLKPAYQIKRMIKRRMRR